MTFIVETFKNPDELITPELLSIRFVNFQQLLTQLSAAKNNPNFVELKTQLNLRILELFDGYTTLVKDSDLLINNITNIKTQLNTFKLNNVTLKEELARMYELSEGSSELINDYKQLYNLKYTRNWGIFLSILFSCYVMSIIFKTKQITI
jgi:hypothetical protein